MFDKRDTPCRMLECHIKPGSEPCKTCGWGEEEHERRVAALRNCEMVLTADGLLTLRVPGKEKTDEA